MSSGLLKPEGLKLELTMKAQAQPSKAAGEQAAGMFPLPAHRYACRSITTGTERDFLRHWHANPTTRAEMMIRLRPLLLEQGWDDSDCETAIATGDIPARVEDANTVFIAQRYAAEQHEHHQWQCHKRQAELRYQRQASANPTGANSTAASTLKPRDRSHRSQPRVTRAGPSDDDPSEPPHAAANPRHRPAWKPVEGAAERGSERLLSVPTLTRLKRARHLIIEGESMPCAQRWELLEAALWPFDEPALTTYNGYSPGEVSTGHKRDPIKAPA